MLVGIGVDICDIRRIEKLLTRFSDRFTRRIFTPAERFLTEQRLSGLQAATYAKRWSAKEACAKALGTGFSQGVFCQDIEVRKMPTGKPTIFLSNGALRRFRDLTDERETARIYVTLTDEYPHALAQVYIES